MNPIITFIIPSIARLSIFTTIDSLKKQSNPNWNAIVIYDGVDGPSFDDDRVKVIKSKKLGLVGPNNGQSGLVRNIGIEETQTEWVGFLDDDDTIHPEYVSTLVRKYSDKDFVVWRMKYQNGMVLPPMNHNQLTFSRVGISFCYKTSLGKILFDNNRDGEDFDFLIKLQNLTNKWVISPEVYYNVRH